MFLAALISLSPLTYGLASNNHLSPSLQNLPLSSYSPFSDSSPLYINIKVICRKLLTLASREIIIARLFTFVNYSLSPIHPELHPVRNKQSCLQINPIFNVSGIMSNIGNTIKCFIFLTVFLQIEYICSTLRSWLHNFFY